MSTLILTLYNCETVKKTIFEKNNNFCLPFSHQKMLKIFCLLFRSIFLSQYINQLPLYSIESGSRWSDHDLTGIIDAQLSTRCVRVSGGIWEVEGGMVVALLKGFPMHHSVKRTLGPVADCHPAYRRRSSLTLIDSGRGHSLTLSLHIKGLLREGDSQRGYITSFSVFTAAFTVC